MSDVLKLLVSVGGQVETSLKRTKSEVDGLDKKIDDINKKGIHPKVSDKTSNSLKDLTKNTDKLKESMQDLKGKGMDALTDSVGSQNMEWIKMAGVLGPVGIGVAAVAVAVTALGVKMTQLAEKNKKLREELSSGYEGGVDEVVRTTAKFKTITEQFGIGEDVLKKQVNALKSNYGVSAEKALEIVEESLIATKGKGAERLDDYAKYAARFKQIGISIDEQQRLLVSGITSGIAEDKLMDFFKGGAEAVLNMDDDLSSMIEKVGIDSKQLKKDIASGKVSAYEAEKKILKAATERLNTTDKQILLTKVFGGVVSEVNTDLVNKISQEKESVDDILKLRKDEFKYLTDKRDLLQEENSLYDKAALKFEGIGAYWKKMTGGFSLDWAVVVTTLTDAVAVIIKSIISVFEAINMIVNVTVDSIYNIFAYLNNGVVKLLNLLGAGQKEMEIRDASAGIDNFVSNMKLLWSDPDIKGLEKKGGAATSTSTTNYTGSLFGDDKKDKTVKGASDSSTNGVARVTSETKSIIFNIDNLVKIDEQNVDNGMSSKQFEAYLTNILVSAINNSQTQF